MKHTKGPWKRGGNYGTLKTEVVTEDGAQVIATVWARKMKRDSERRGETEPWPEGEANLNLIQAAPELLEALKEVLEDYEAVARTTGLRPEDFDNIVKARAAIAKAEGKEYEQ